MSFTCDFFSEQMPVWQDPDGPLAELRRRAANGEPLALLEVGAYEGRSTCWMLKNLAYNPGSQMVSIDHFDSAHTMDGVARFDRFMRNTISVDKCSALEVIPAFSSDAFIRLKHDERCFDLAYIDGSHHRLETTEDAISAWRCLKQNGILIFDDYKWDQHPFDSIEHPHDAIDSFVHLVAPESEVVHRGYQLFLRKAAGPRHAVAHPRCEPFIIVLAADESYAAPLAVAMHTILRSCMAPSKLLFVLIDEGLKTPNTFVEIAIDGGAKCSIVSGRIHEYPTESATWSKLWLDVLVPSSATVLYVDADTLCRHDVLALHALGSSVGTLGAVVDFGVPNHFNAGLMLVNLCALRESGLGERLRARACTDGARLKFLDQDVLNEEVKTWTPLPLEWNVQGLGTYAAFRTRAEPHFPPLFTVAELTRLEHDPHMIHFTGSSTFSVADCLNQYCPGPTKPWVPLCKHPRRDEWLEALDQTFMRGWRPPLAEAAECVLRESLRALELISSDGRCSHDGSIEQLKLHLGGTLDSLSTTTYEIAVLLPLRCTEEFPVDVWVNSVNASFAALNAKLFIGVDEDDAGWAACQRVLNSKLALAVPYEVKIFPPVKPAIICPIWASLALKAYHSGCSYFVLWGDDVRVEPADWFSRSVKPRLGPTDLACVAPIDVNDPSVATFPIVTRAHFDVFGRLFSPRFINQDADPYLFELYRRVGRASVLTDARVINLRGGAASWPVQDANPRYDRQSLLNWKQECLVPDAHQLMKAIGSTAAHFVTIDVVVPSFRTPYELLHRMTSLQDPPGCSVKYIIIVDDPSSPNLDDIVKLQSERVRVRVNSENIGASASRSRGLAEACAEWVLFFDDDVKVTQACLNAYALVAAKHGAQYSGFVGSTILPPVANLLHEATRLSDITFFYNLPKWMGRTVPWGVTANIMVRRVDGLDFDTVYAKTGGGEDVDYCIELVHALKLPLGRVVEAEVMHEWWPCADGRAVAYLHRFWKWTMGDGHLLYKHPQYVYMSFPNVVELSLALILTAGWLVPCVLVLRLLAAIWMVEIGCETVRALNGPEARHLDTTDRFIAAFLSFIVKNVIDAGHLTFHLIRMRPGFALHRFDFFLGRHDLPAIERRKFAWRNALWIAAMAHTIMLTIRS